MHSTNFKYKQAWNLNKSALQCNINKMMHVVSNILVKRSFFIPSRPEHDYALEFALKPAPSQNSMSFFRQTKPDSPCKPLSKSSVSLEIFLLLQSISLDLHGENLRPRPQFGGNYAAVQFYCRGFPQRNHDERRSGGKIPISRADASPKNGRRFFSF